MPTSSSVTACCSDLRDYLLPLAAPVTLAPGRYWLAVRTGTADDNAVFYWQYGAAAAGAAALTSTDGGATWSTIGLTADGIRDLAFAVFGSAQATQTITFPPITPNPATVGGTTTLGASASSGLSVTYATTTPAVCTVSGSTLAFVGAGTCTVTADQAGDASYPAAPQAAQSVTVVKAAQAITFTAPASALIGNTLTLSATGGASGNPVTFSTASAACTVSGNTVTFTAVGPCAVTANQAGSATYADAAPVTRAIQVVWPFAGFFAPVNNAPTVNTAKAGSAIPIKFALGGDRGLAVLAAGSPTSQAYACQAGAPTDPGQQTPTAGASALGYDAVSGQYTYVWKTDAAWAGTCRQLTLTLADGTQHVALFQFK